MESATTGHLDEGDVIRILDGEATDEERAVWTSHLRSCESCRRLHDEVEQQSAWFRATTALLDPTAGVDDLTKARALAAVRSSRLAKAAGTDATPSYQGTGAGGAGRTKPSRSGALGLRFAAAAAGIVVLAGLTVAPVRAWIRDNVLSNATPVEEPISEEAAVTSGSEAEVIAPAATARFDARGPVFRIDLDQRQQEGTLTVRLTTAEQGSARIVSTDDEGLLWVPPSGLRIGNGTESSASYIVELPASQIREIVVRAGGQPLGSRTLSAAGEEVELDLAAEDARP